MVYVNTDDTMLVKELGRFVEPVEIRDADGKVLGLFVPANLERGKELYAKLAGRTDWEEIGRRDAAGGPGKTTREVFERLKTMTTDPAELADLQRHIDVLAERERCPSQ